MKVVGIFVHSDTGRRDQGKLKLAFPLRAGPLGFSTFLILGGLKAQNLKNLQNLKEKFQKIVKTFRN